MPQPTAKFDLGQCVLHKVFGVEKTPGLSNFFVERRALNEVLHEVSVDGAAPIHVLPAGRFPPNPAEILASPHMKNLLEQLEGRNDVVVIDSPPLTMVTDAAALSHAVDAVFLVARAGRTEKGALEFAVRQLRNVMAPLKGTILNDVTAADRRYGSYGYYAYQYEYYGADED